MMKRLALLVLLMALLVVSGGTQDLSPADDDAFKDICPGSPSPWLEQLNPPILATYFWTQYINTEGDLVVVYFSMNSEESSRKVFEGDWCDLEIEASS